jgi:hypothetical protein
MIPQSQTEHDPNNYKLNVFVAEPNGSPNEVRLTSYCHGVSRTSTVQIADVENEILQTIKYIDDTKRLRENKTMKSCS